MSTFNFAMRPADCGSGGELEGEPSPIEPKETKNKAFYESAEVKPPQ
jgi:hypothetical protein